MGSWRQQLQIWAQNRREAFAAVRDGPRAQGTTEIELPFEFELVPAGTSTVEAVIDPALRDRVAAAISVRNARVMGSRIDLYIDTDPPPIDLGFDVFARAGEREWRAGILTATAAYPLALQRAVHLRGLVREDYIASEEIPDSSSVEVILRPSAEAAIRSPDIVRYWGEEVSIRRVRLFNPMQRKREMKAIADAHRRRAGGVPSTAPAATSTAPENAR
jgi:hypothetical protein